MAERFEISFDGPAIEDHAIDAAILGESLVALADLLYEARDVAFPDGPRYRIRVEQANEGSFEVSLLLAEWWDTAVSIFNDPNAQAITFLLSVFGKDGLIGFLIWLRGKKPRYEQISEDTLKVYAEDRVTTISFRVGEMASSLDIRRSLRKIVGPISEDSIDKLVFRIPNNEPIEIDPTNRSYLAASMDDDKITDEMVEMWLRVHTARFESDRWWFRDSVTGRMIRATVTDQGWRDRIERGEVAVRKNDSIHAMVRIEQWDRDDQPDEYTVVQVLETINDAGGQGRIRTGPEEEE